MTRRTTRSIPDRRVPVVNPRDGTMTDAWYLFFDLMNREIGGDNRNIIGGLLDGTTEVLGVTVAGRGSVTDELDAINSNVEQVADTAAQGGTNGLTATRDAASAYATTSVPNVALTTNAINITPSGGTGGPYTFNTVYVSGDAGIAVASATSGSPEFTGTVLNQSLYAIFQTTIGDGTNSITLRHNVSLVYTPGFG